MFSTAEKMNVDANLTLLITKYVFWQTKTFLSCRVKNCLKYFVWDCCLTSVILMVSCSASVIIWATSLENLPGLLFANNKGADQPVHLRNLFFSLLSIKHTVHFLS